jgi:hypothetical protein
MIDNKNNNLHKAREACNEADECQCRSRSGGII